MSIEKEILRQIYKNINHCHYCFGTGKLKAMQSATINNTTSMRYKDTEVKCKHCNGTGFIN